MRLDPPLKVVPGAVDIGIELIDLPAENLGLGFGEARVCEIGGGRHAAFGPDYGDRRQRPAMACCHGRAPRTRTRRRAEKTDRTPCCQG
jgi:hypothetical protein